MKIKKKKKGKEKGKIFPGVSETDRIKGQISSGTFGAAPLDENHTHVKEIEVGKQNGFSLFP